LVPPGGGVRESALCYEDITKSLFVLRFDPAHSFLLSRQGVRFDDSREARPAVQPPVGDGTRIEIGDLVVARIADGVLVRPGNPAGLVRCVHDHVPPAVLFFMTDM